MKRSLLAVMLLAATATAAPARFTRLSVQDGLSQSTVQAIVQDHVGFLWFGTEEGLNRYDGYSFVVFKHDPSDPGSLPDDVISALYEDRQQRLWVGTGLGLAMFDRRSESFVRVASIRLRVSAILEDRDGTLWVATEGDGLFERSPASGAWVAHARDADDPASLAGDVLAALLRDRAGRLWIGSKDGGLDRMEVGGRRFIHYRHDPRVAGSLSHNEVWGLAEDPAGRLWVATYGGGLNVLDPEATAFRCYRHREGDPRGLRTDLLTALYVDRAGTLWVGTDGAGVQRYDAASDSFVALLHDPADPASLSQNVVRTINEDAQGQLWIGTYLGGANLLRNARAGFDYYTRQAADASSLADPGVASFLEDTTGRLWVGTEGGWLEAFDAKTGRFVHHRLPSGVPGGSAVLSLHQDRRGRVWVGTYRGGLFRFDPQRGAFTSYPYRRGDPGSPGEEVWAMAEEEDGTLWLGTEVGVQGFDPERGVVTTHYTVPNAGGGASSADVRALLLDRSGNLWVGTLSGLNLRLRGGGGLTHYKHDEKDPRSLSHDSVVALHEDRAGRIWVGTFGGGVNRFDTATRTFTLYKGLPSSAVYRIEEDGSGRLWLSTNRGLARLEPESGRITSFDMTNGLQSLQFRLGASLATRSGRLLFGSQDGFYDFDPEAIKPDDYAPAVVFTSLRVFDKPAQLPAALSTLDAVTISHRDKILSLGFAALDYAIPRRNQYAYRIEGFSEGWIHLGEKRDVTLTNLDPGRYVFRVKASNSDGIWRDASTAALAVIVAPPYWGTWWFRALAALALGAALLASQRARLRHATAELAERRRAELALCEAEEKYRGIFENAVEGIFQATPDGRIVTANPALARMLGFASMQELIAETTDIAAQYEVDPGDRDAFTRMLELHGRLRDFTTHVRRKDGKRLWLSVSARAVTDASGALLYYEGSAEDMTERLRAQQAEAGLRGSLEAAAAEWELTFDSIEDSILILDGVGRVMRLNRAAKLAAGRPYEAILGRALVDLGPAQPWLEASDVAARAGEMRVTAHSRACDEDSGKTWDVTANPLRGPRGEERISVVIRGLS